MNRASGGGGLGVSGINVTLDDEATNSLPGYGVQLATGTYKPSEPLSVFDGKLAKGT
jgi:hypothetical protein